jgi:hypothetical protein
LPATHPAAQPARAIRSDIDPAVIGNFEADSMVDDYKTHVVYTITADGEYRLVTTQEESGTYRSAFGIYRTTAAGTHRVRTGTYRAVGTTAIEVTGATGSAVFQPAQPGPPLNPQQPVMLGTWHATVLQGSLSWALTIQNNPGGVEAPIARPLAAPPRSNRHRSSGCCPSAPAAQARSPSPPAQLRADAGSVPA